MNKIKLRT